MTMNSLPEWKPFSTLKAPIILDVSPTYPPMFDEIAAVFPTARLPGVLFCWGTTIHNPSGIKVSDALIAHEEVHSEQQGCDPDKWWLRYIHESVFRLEQEKPAHIRELIVATNHGRAHRHFRRQYTALLAKRLSSPLYGKMILRPKAESLLRHALKEERERLGL